MADERTVGERLGVVEIQLEALHASLTTMSDGIAELTRSVNVFTKSSAVIEARLLAHDKELVALTERFSLEFARGREHMARTDEEVKQIKSKCDQTESLRIAGQRHIDEAPKEHDLNSKAWIGSDMATKIVLALLGSILALLLYLATGGKIG